MKKNIPAIFIVLLSLPYVFSRCNSATSSRDNAIATDTLSIRKGKSLFENNCSSCHNFIQNGIGPELSGITGKHRVEWIRRFIGDPKKMIDSGDTTAQKLFKTYRAVMPSFNHFTEDDVEAIIAYLHTKKAQQRKLVPEDTNDIKNPIPDTITTSQIVAGLDFFTQIPHSAPQPPFTRITKLDYQPSTGELFILDLRGKLYQLRDRQPVLYMDMASLRPKFITQPGIATGFGSFAFHPEFSKNGLLYTTHAEMPGSAKADFDYPESAAVVLQWVLTEWKTDPGKFPFSGTAREIFRINMPSAIHGVQEIAFNRFAKKGDEDYGLLYIGVGDGGSTEIGHPLVSTQPEKVWGSILRIDPLGRNSRNGAYGIPASNPFVHPSGKKAASEVYAYGFRNPHRINWSTSGQLFAVNIGEHNIESLNMIFPGHFYGWPIREGNFEVRFFNDVGKIYPLPPNDSMYHVTYPVAQFDHDDGTAIAGGFDYQGKAVPALKGKYVFADIGSGNLFFVNMKDLQPGKQATIKKWNISVNGKRTTLARLCGNNRVEMRFGMDKQGELYIMTKADGKVYRLVNQL